MGYELKHAHFHMELSYNPSPSPPTTGIDGGITSRRYAEEMLTAVFIIYLMNAIQQVVMTSCPIIIVRSSSSFENTYDLCRRDLSYSLS